jgi:hyperpolarization activated cyclic nucleotide-gated potassium channel 2
LLYDVRDIPYQFHSWYQASSHQFEIGCLIRRNPLNKEMTIASPGAQRMRSVLCCLPNTKVEPDRKMHMGGTLCESLNSSREELPAASGFSAMFHVSTDNKLAQKFFGNTHDILEEQKRQHNNYHWIIHPYSSFRWNWDFFMVILLFVTVIFLPVNIAFYQDDFLVSWSVLNCFTDLVFLIDIILNFRTGIIASDSYDQVILEPKQIAQRYLRGWFCIDILSSIPFDYFTLILSSQNKSLHGSLIRASRALRVLRMAKILSLLRLLRVSRLFRYVQRWEEVFDVAGGVIRIVNLIGTMLLLSHWNGCIQFLIPYLQGIPEDSWIAINRLENETPWIQYSWALFKAMSHMLCIGFGKFPPQTTTEVWLTILSMVTGATFYALFIGHMSSLLMSSDSSGRLYNEKAKQLD